jgi:DHA2 family multidrug resistance protein-like MFS transporter
MSPEDRSDERATRREWLGLAVIALPCVLYSMDLTVLDLAVPALSVRLRPTGAELLWILDVYGFLVAGSLITMGTLGDRIGRRRLLLFGASAFGAASIFAAFAGSAGALIAARAVLGVAGATLAPSTLSLIRNMFREPAERRLAIGVWVSSYSAGTALGPLIGGVVLEHFWPGAAFLIGVPPMLLLLLTGPFLLPEFRDPRAGTLDLQSAGLSLAAVLLVVCGLKWIADGDFGGAPVACIATGALLGALFLRRQPRLATPLLDLGLLRSPVFRTALAAYGLSSFVALGMYVLVAQYLQLVLGLSPLRAGAWTVPLALAFIAGSLLTPVLSRRVALGVLLPAGLALAAAGFALLTRLEADGGPVLAGVSLALFALGLSPVITLSTDVMVGSVAPERAGATAALSETSSELGGALGIALLGSVGTFAFRRAMEAAPLSAMRAAATARRTLTAALAAARELDGPARTELVESARFAFTHSVRIAAGIATVITLVLALTTAVVLRRDREPSRLATNERAPS